MIMEGEFLLYQDNELIKRCKNHLTKDAAIFMLSCLNSGQTTTIYYPSNTSYMTLRAGKGTGVVPSYDVTALKEQVISIPAAQIVTLSNYTDTTFEFVVRGDFTQANMSTFGQNKMTELGFFSSAPIITTYNWTENSPTSKTVKLLGYISSPNDFSDTDVDVTKALTAEWKLKFIFGGI